MRSCPTPCNAASVDTLGTARVLEAVFEQLRPHLAPGAGIKVSPRKKWTIVQRADSGSEDVGGLVVNVSQRDERGRLLSTDSSGVSVRGGLGPWMPFLPRSLRRRLAAQNALETLLGLFYEPDQGAGFHRSVNCAVNATASGGGISLSYTMPGTSEAITLRPLPEDLFE